MKSVITISRTGYTHISKGGREVVAHYLQDTRGNQYIKVEYFSEECRRFSLEGVCQVPSLVRTEIGAKRLINKFLNNK